MAVQLESGLWQFQADEVERLGEAAVSYAANRGVDIDVTQPVTMDTWVFLELEHASLKGDTAFLTMLLEIVTREIELRERNARQ